MSLFDLLYTVYKITPKDEDQQQPVDLPPSNLIVKDEALTLSHNITTIDFKGSGVVAKKTKDGVIEVQIDQIGGTAVSENIFTKYNNTNTTIPAFYSTSLKPDGTIVPMDLTQPEDEEFYGIAIEEIPPFSNGQIQIGGIIAGALIGKGYTTDETIYSILSPGQYALKDQIPQVVGVLIYKIGRVVGTGNDLLIEKKKIMRY